MSRFTRTFAAAIVLIALLAAAGAPALQARPLAKPRPALLAGDWLAAAVTWLGQLFDPSPQAPAARGSEKGDGDIVRQPLPSPYPNRKPLEGPLPGGSCIDPMGNPCELTGG